MDLDSWLPDPLIPDETFVQNEPALLHLRRATDETAILHRNQLRSLLAGLSDDVRLHFQLELERRNWASTLVELNVASALNSLGAQLELEKELETGRKPDFLAHLPSGSIIVEAVAPVVNGKLYTELIASFDKRQLIDPYCPPGYRYRIEEFPELGPNDSKKAIKRVLSQWQRSTPVNRPEHWDFYRELENWQYLHFEMWNFDGESGWIGGGIGAAAFCDAKWKLLQAYEKKKKQLRGSRLPSYVAIRAAGEAGLSDFDAAFFGSGQGEYFEATGALAKGEGPSNVCGILAFVGGAIQLGAPVLYLHPRARHSPPPEFSQFEQRQLSEGKILVTPPVGGPEPQRTI